MNWPWRRKIRLNVLKGKIVNLAAMTNGWMIFNDNDGRLSFRAREKVKQFQQYAQGYQGLLSMQGPQGVQGLLGESIPRRNPARHQQAMQGGTAGIGEAA